MINVTINQDKYELAFDYDAKLVQFCKNLQASRYDPHHKVWRAARNVPNAIDLHQAGYFSDGVMLCALPSMPASSGGYQWMIKATLFDHQQRFKEWVSQRSKALLCAEMGTGKTIMSMLFLQTHGIDPADVLVVCPASLVGNWLRELDKFAGIKAHAVQGTPAKRKEALTQPGLHVVNYEYLPQGKTLRQEVAALKKTAVILDESHKIKNPSSERSKVLHKYCDGKSHVLLLTGTPVSQGAQDYFSQFKAIDPRLLGSSFTAFKTRYCEQEQVKSAPPGVKRITGYRKLTELSDIIRPYTYNILKKDCLDLPEKHYVTHFVELSPEQRKFYNTLNREMAAWLEGQSETEEPVTAQNILTRYIRLGQVTQGHVTRADGTEHEFAENPKLDMLLELIDALPPKESVIVVCRFRHDIRAIRQALEKLGTSILTMDGDVPIPERQGLVDDFQRGRARVFIGQIVTMGVGFNMTRASTMIFFSNSYSLTDRLQAEDRIHRIGSTGERCTYIDLVATDTVDEHVVKALTSKQDVAQVLTRLRQNNDPQVAAW